ncbi:MAG: 50S ribosomal protein L6 [Candidatus Omnitrophica bacterium]|nr:50S ribosomal protein L6 [Candidatus Omnitrophota bacterium]
MSRVGKKPVEVPKEVKLEINGRLIKMEAKGKTLQYELHEGFTAELNGAILTVKRPSDSRESKALHGTARSLIANMVKGLKTGFEKKLEIQGVGYKAQLKGKVLALELGKSHTVNYNIPVDIVIETPSQTEIVIKGINKQSVGQTAAEIRKLYPPEPYKGKGIRYAGEYVRRKQGKSVA